MALAGLKRFFGDTTQRDHLARLYLSVTAAAREPAWYVQGLVPDTVEGRFEMVAVLFSLVLLRLEKEGALGATQASLLTEIFIADMDAQMRESGIGDAGVGLRMGKVMSALGGRLGAYRDGFAGDGLNQALVRNLYRGESPSQTALAFVAHKLRDRAQSLATLSIDAVLAGQLEGA